jgi:malonyl-CoA/methylmalonyl-CoA synthetase
VTTGQAASKAFAASGVDGTTLEAWRRHDPTLPESPDPRDLARRLRGGSISRALRRRARSGGRHTIIGVDGEAVSLVELHRQTERLAIRLAADGAGPSGATLLAAPPSLDFIRCYLALLAIRSPVVPANPNCTAHELESQISGSGATLAITGGQASDTVADVVGGDVAHVPLQRLSGQAGSLPPEGLPRSSDVAVCAFTSGTTGAPKLAPLRHGDIQASIRSAMRAWRWHRNDVLVHALPMYHQHGLSALHAAILSGSSLHCFSRFDPGRLIGEAQRRDATVIFAVPAMWERIVAAHAAVDAPRLRLLISGSAPLPPTLFDRIAATFGKPPLERYGTTESGLNVSNLYGGPRQPGGVGFPLPGVEIAIDGGTRELSVRGPQLFAGYAGRAPLRSGQWFPTGDLAEREPGTGAIRIIGRSKDIIITGGMNVAPLEVEDVLVRHDAVDAVAVVGVPSARWGEEVTAFVVSTSGFSVDELRRWTRSRLSSHKVPKRFHDIEEIPRNPTGKILRNELVARGVSLASEPDADRSG